MLIRRDVNSLNERPSRDHEVEPEFRIITWKTIQSSSERKLSLFQKNQKECYVGKNVLVATRDRRVTE